MASNPCPICGGKRFHRFGCSTLTASAFCAGGVVGVITIAVAANEATGARGGNVAVGAALTVVLLALGLVSWLKRARSNAAD
jgi:hypothetical protein